MMEDKEVIRLIGQFLHEHGYTQALEALTDESGRRFDPATMVKKTGELQAILDEHLAKEKIKEEASVSLDRLFEPGQQEYANELWCSLGQLTAGMNILVVRLLENGALAIGASKAMVVTAELSVPISWECPPSILLSTNHLACNGAVLAINFHPTKRNLLLGGSMDRTAFLLDLDRTDNTLVKKFQNHTKYVVQAQWAPSGKYFATASYDTTVCVYRETTDEAEEMYELLKTLTFKGAVESFAFQHHSDVFVVGVRNDYLLYCYTLESGSPVKTREINMNALGDDFVSFTAMFCSFSPDDKYILLSTDKDRLILYGWNTGKQIANFYGGNSDTYGQPRHCWDQGGRYIYGSSQDMTICVWEVRSQKLVTRLEGHTGTVRDLCFCDKLGLLVSAGYDGSVKLWRNTLQPILP